MAAQDEGLTETTRTHATLLDEATSKIEAARDLADKLVEEGVIVPVPA